MIDPPKTLLGSAHRDALVPFVPAHWAELRARWRHRTEATAGDDALGIAIDMSATVRTVLVDGRPECVVGLSLLPDNCGSPWIMAPHPDVARFSRAVLISEQFIDECLQRHRVLCVERDQFDNATRLWLSGLRFKLISFDGPFERWERVAGTSNF